VEKFCAGCQNFRDIKDGKNVMRNKRNRWICNICIERSNQSPYLSKKNLAKTIPTGESDGN